MKKIYFFAAFIVGSMGLKAQVVIDNSQTVQSAVEDIFLGNGIFVSNIMFNGQAADVVNDQFGRFTDMDNGIGITGGLCMSTGVSADMAATSSGLGAPSSPYWFQDPDVLALLTNEFNLGDLASLEFDFIATGDICNFQYVFASDEYPEWVETAFNDHFGFFVSGPEIMGPYSNGAINIALIPGTTENVGINSLNAVDHSEYYVDNMGVITSVGFDAFTTVLNAHIENLVVGEVYHVKLVIADVSDSALDSGVFLRGDSFQQECSNSGPNGIQTETCMLSSLHAEVHYTENCGTVSLTNLSEMNIETTNCYFEMGDGNTTAACDANTTYSYDAPGLYNLKLVYEVNAFKAKFTVGQILISDTPATMPVIGFNNEENLTVTNWDGVSALQWYLDGTAIVGATGIAYEVNAPGSYTVVANNGCPSESETFTILSTEDQNDRSVGSVYPNPGIGMIQVVGLHEPFTLEVYNASGQMVANERVQSGRVVQIPQSAGLYAVKMLGDSGRLTQAMVIVQ